MQVLRTMLYGMLVVVLVVCPASAQMEGHNATHSSQPGEGKLNVAVLLYDGALLLDYGIAAEMFLAADFMRSFAVYTVAHEPAVNLSIVGATTADYTYANAPKPDVVIVPGGPTWMQEGERPETIAFLKKAQADGAILYSICTGAMVLAKAGLLDGRPTTTNHQAAGMLRSLAPTATVFADSNFVDDGDLVTAAGSGTAIEATLHLIARLKSLKIAEDLRKRYLDYPHSGE